MEYEDDQIQPTLGRQVSDLIAVQTHKVGTLSRDLARSYEKELLFFQNLKERDRQLREQELRFTKKIWWLESERRTLLERNASLEADIRRMNDRLIPSRRQIRHALERAAPGALNRVRKVKQLVTRAAKGVRTWR